MRASYAFEFLL